MRRWAIWSRAACWLALGSSAVWFYAVSPKTPLESFDTGVNDNRISNQLSVKEGALPPIAERRAWEMERLTAKLERLALQYDLEHNPELVKDSCWMIAEGCYSCNMSTRLALHQADPVFRQIENQIGNLRVEMQKSHPRKNEQQVKVDKQSDWYDEASTSRSTYYRFDRMQLRYLQTFLWRFTL